MHRNFAGVFAFGNGGNGGGLSTQLNSSDINDVLGEGSGAIGFDDRNSGYGIATQGKLIGFYSGAGGAGGGRYSVQSLPALPVQGYGAGGSASGATCSGISIDSVAVDGADGSVILQFYY